MEPSGTFPEMSLESSHEMFLKNVYLRICDFFIWHLYIIEPPVVLSKKYSKCLKYFVFVHQAPSMMVHHDLDHIWYPRFELPALWKYAGYRLRVERTARSRRRRRTFLGEIVSFSYLYLFLDHKNRKTDYGWSGLRERRIPRTFSRITSPSPNFLADIFPNLLFAAALSWSTSWREFIL